MCQIQLIHKIGGGNLEEYDLVQLDRMMVLGTKHNEDAWGIISKTGIDKAYGMWEGVNINSKDDLLKSHFLIGHNRLSTMGDVPYKWNWFWSKENKKLPQEEIDIIENNSHPFVLNDLALVHNGIIHNNFDLRSKFDIKDDIKTDSFVILFLIDHFLKISKLKARKDKIIEGIKKTCDLIEGSYSVFLYDSLEDNVYYFKDHSTRFSFRIYDKKYILGSTEGDNLNCVYNNLKSDNHKFIDYIPSGDKIYMINKNPVKIKGKEKDEKNVGLKSKAVRISKFFNKEESLNDEAESLITPIATIKCKKKECLLFDDGRKIYKYQIPGIDMYSTSIFIIAALVTASLKIFTYNHQNAINPGILDVARQFIGTIWGISILGIFK